MAWVDLFDKFRFGQGERNHRPSAPQPDSSESGAPVHLRCRRPVLAGTGPGQHGNAARAGSTSR